uniref:Uncharacterized protein n=1 Tax=Plectus sambesii TaxID=2011161 RepID=A0A914W8J3_9BILA
MAVTRRLRLLVIFLATVRIGACSLLLKDTERKPRMIYPHLAVKRNAEHYSSFKDPSYGRVGLKNSAQKICLLVEMKGRLVLHRVGATTYDDKEYIDDIPDLAVSNNAAISGHCSPEDDRNKDAELYIEWLSERNRNFTYRLALQFTANKTKQKTTGLDEWRWELYDVSLELKHLNHSIVGVGKKKAEINAPILQSFICKDSMNVTLVGRNGSTPMNVTLQLAKNMKIQPFGVLSAGGYGITYMCKKTRDRSLVESLRGQTTVVMGVILGIASVGVIMGYGTKRQFFPNQQTYQVFQ